MNAPTKIITHTSASSRSTTVSDIDAWHKARWPGFTSRAGYHVGYHLVIDWFGEVTQTREFNEEGAHCIGQNSSSIGVCFIGNGDFHEPSAAQINAWKKVFKRINTVYPHITKNDIYPHRKWANKTCHGKLLSDTYYADKLPGDDKQATLKAKIIELQAIVNRLYSILAKQRMKSTALIP